MGFSNELRKYNEGLVMFKINKRGVFLIERKML